MYQYSAFSLVLAAELCSEFLAKGSDFPTNGAVWTWVIIQNKDALENFERVSIFTVFPVKEVIKFMKNELQIDHVLQDQIVLRVRAVKE